MELRIVAHHPVADVYWYSEWDECQVNDLSEMIKEMCKGAGY